MILHHFTAGGVYVREQKLLAGQIANKHVHDYDHLSYLVQGEASIEIDGDLSILRAPAMLEVKAGKQHRIHALTDIVWLCIHAESIADSHVLNKE